jgi:hypothetical protein
MSEIVLIIIVCACYIANTITIFAWKKQEKYIALLEQIVANTFTIEIIDKEKKYE